MPNTKKGWWSCSCGRAQALDPEFKHHQEKKKKKEPEIGGSFMPKAKLGQCGNWEKTCR
jgi:hypothetical protein